MIEILLAAYNGEKYIKKQIRSILANSEQDFHITVRDDGSSDRTAEIVQKLADKYPDKLTLVKDGKPTGSAAGNFMEMVRTLPEDTEYVMFADQDDIWSRYKIGDSLFLIKDMEQAYGTEAPLLVHTDLMVVDENEQIISRSLIEYMQLPYKDDLKHLLLQNSVTGCTILMNNALLKLLKRACDSDEIIIHDHYAAVLAAAFGHVGCVRIPTVKYRQHGDNEVGASDAKSLSYKMRRLKRGKKEFANSMDAGYKQAALLVSLYPEEVAKMSEADRELLTGYAELIKKTHKERVKFFRKHEMYKRSFSRMIMQMIWS